MARFWRPEAALIFCALCLPAGAQHARFDACVAFEKQIGFDEAAAQGRCRDSFEYELPDTTLTVSPGAVVNTSRDHVVTRFEVRRVGGACDGARGWQLKPLWPGHRRDGAARNFAWVPPQTGTPIRWAPPTCPAGAGERPGVEHRLIVDKVFGLKIR